MFRISKTYQTDDQWADERVQALALIFPTSVHHNGDSIFVEGWVFRTWSDQMFLALATNTPCHTGVCDRCEFCLMESVYGYEGWDYEQDIAQVSLSLADWGACDLSSRFLLVDGDWEVEECEPVATGRYYSVSGDPVFHDIYGEPYSIYRATETLSVSVLGTARRTQSIPNSEPFCGVTPY